jgi:ketosteroid isomerase-like protein
MKKQIFCSVALAAILFSSCAREAKTELTDEQKAAIVTEVEKVHSDVIANLSKLDIDIWTESWSKDEFFAASSGVNYFRTLDEFRDSVKYWFSLREKQQVRIVERDIKVLAPDLVLLTSTLNWDIQFKNGEQTNSNSLTTMLWRKELGAWKCICLHESWKGN